MISQDHKSEIAALQLQLKEFEKLLDEYISDDEILSKSKIILKEIKRISQRIIILKNLDENTSKTNQAES